MADISLDTQRDTFLAHFSTARRSFVANIFLFAVREGARTPLDVLAAVGDALHTRQERAAYWNNEDDLERYASLSAAIAQYYPEALNFAQWALAWEQLTPAEKARRRGAQGEAHRRTWMEQQPATEKQIAYVRALGYVGEVTSKAHASELIDQLRNRQAGVRA